MQGLEAFTMADFFIQVAFPRDTDCNFPTPTRPAYDLTIIE
jgi:hypothetical protein